MNHLIILIAAAIPAAAAPAPSPRSELKASIEQLQKTPDDAALREKIIKLARSVKPAPAITDEARQLAGEGAAALKNAKSPADAKDAADAYRKASLLAPWAADLYFNMSVAQEKAEQYDAAIASLRFYLLASPTAKDRDAIQERIGGLKYMAGKAATAAQSARAAEARYGWILGEWDSVLTYRGHRRSPDAMVAKRTGDGVEFFLTAYPDGHAQLRATLDASGDATWDFWQDPAEGCPGFSGWVRASMSVSSDHQRLDYRYFPPFSGHCERISPFSYDISLTRR